MNANDADRRTSQRQACAGTLTSNRPDSITYDDAQHADDYISTSDIPICLLSRELPWRLLSLEDALNVLPGSGVSQARFPVEVEYVDPDEYDSQASSRYEYESEAPYLYSSDQISADEDAVQYYFDDEESIYTSVRV